MAERTPQGLSPYERRRDHTFVIVLGFVIASVVAHVVGFGALSMYVEGQKRVAPVNRPIEMVMIEVPPPPPPKVEEPPPPPPEPKPKPKPRPPPVKVAAAEKPPPPPEVEAPPPPNDTPPPETPSKPVPLVVGISMSSTTSAGGFAAPVGNTVYGKVDGKAQNPAEVKAYQAPKYVPVYQVDREPELLGEVKIPYPAEARRAGIEGTVVMAIEIDADGHVSGVKVMDGPGYGLDEAAARAVKRFRWRPAAKNGEAVSTRLTWKYTFLLD